MTVGTPILAPTSFPEGSVKAWAIERKEAHARFLNDYVPWLYNAAPVYGIDPVVAVVLCGHETGFGHHGGVVEPKYNNLCGLKWREGGDDYDPHAHARFATVEVGAHALCQHLSAYAGVQPEDWRNEVLLVDPRYDWVGPGSQHFGTAEVVEDLSAWASAADYGDRLAAHIVDLNGYAGSESQTTTDEGQVPRGVVEDA